MFTRSPDNYTSGDHSMTAREQVPDHSHHIHQARHRAEQPACRACAAEEEAAAAEQVRLVVAHALAGTIVREETRSMLHELAARTQRRHPTEWAERFTAAYTRAQESLGLAETPATAAEEHALVERVRRDLDAQAPSSTA